ncbi:MAG: ribosomal protein S12 methylthiotransferase, partial [Planctomycetota bacterium]
PNLTLRTTVLLGFPGETDSDAAEVVDLVRDYGLSRLGAFTYSPEEGTSGFDLKHDVPEDVAMARRDAVLEARDAELKKTQEAAIGTEVEILVDEPPDPDGGIVVGRGSMDAPEVDMVTFAHAPDAAVGDRIMVRIDETDAEQNWIGAAVNSSQAAS